MRVYQITMLVSGIGIASNEAVSTASTPCCWELTANAVQAKTQGHQRFLRRKVSNDGNGNERSSNDIVMAEAEKAVESLTLAGAKRKLPKAKLEDLVSTGKHAKTNEKAQKDSEATSKATKKRF